MTPSVFINYRRGDDPGTVGRLFDRLEHELGHGMLFMDLEGSIKPGDDFVDALRQHVDRCTILLAVIGPRWLSVLDEDGRRRIANPEDWVRVEIASALASGKLVIPVLVGGAAVPQSSDLPDDLKPLARRQAVRLSLERFRSDADSLARQIKVQLAAPRPAPEPAKAARPNKAAGPSKPSPSAKVAPKVEPKPADQAAPATTAAPLDERALWAEFEAAIASNNQPKPSQVNAFAAAFPNSVHIDRVRGFQRQSNGWFTFVCAAFILPAGLMLWFSNMAESMFPGFTPSQSGWAVAAIAVTVIAVLSLIFRLPKPYAVNPALVGILGLVGIASLWVFLLALGVIGPALSYVFSLYTR